MVDMYLQYSLHLYKQKYNFKLQNSVFKPMHECKYSKICLLDCVPHLQMKMNIVFRKSVTVVK